MMMESMPSFKVRNKYEAIHQKDWNPNKEEFQWQRRKKLELVIAKIITWALYPIVIVFFIIGTMVFSAGPRFNSF